MKKRLQTGNEQRRVRAVDVIAFIERCCFVPEGLFVGQPLKLLGFQKEIIRLIYDNPHGTRRAIISVGRKNAKSTPASFSITSADRLRSTARTASSTAPRNRAIKPR